MPNEPDRNVWVLWRFRDDDYELLGAFTSPEKFQAYVEQRFRKMVPNSRWRKGETEWILSTPQWEFVATKVVVDALPNG